MTLSHKCYRGTVHKSLSQWSHVSYTAAQLGLCSVILKRRIKQQRLEAALECQIRRQGPDSYRLMLMLQAMDLHAIKLQYMEDESGVRSNITLMVLLCPGSIWLHRWALFCASWGRDCLPHRTRALKHSRWNRLQATCLHPTLFSGTAPSCYPHLLQISFPGVLWSSFSSAAMWHPLKCLLGNAYLPQVHLCFVKLAVSHFLWYTETNLLCCIIYSSFSQCFRTTVKTTNLTLTTGQTTAQRRAKIATAHFE